jgi:amidohydrolase
MAHTEGVASEAVPTAGRRALATEILAAARDILPWMIEIRRDLHQHPELGLEEHRTAQRIQEWLDELGIDHLDGLAGTGVLATIRADTAGRCVALRADIDALPLEDAKDVAYRSRKPGMMHACGHDAHTAVLLGAARLLMTHRDRLAGTVKLIFQPAEETVGGAKLLIEEGVMRNPRVDAIFGLHVDNAFDVGTLGLRYGQRNASSDNLRLVIHGRSGHGAYPSSGIDAIVVAAQVVSALQSIVSRNVDARESAVVTFGTIRGGNQDNILAQRVELSGTIRCLEAKTRELVVQRVRETAEGVATALGARAEVDIEPSYDPLINDDGMVDVVRENAVALVGEENVRIVPHANMGVEDFGYYLSHAPGAFYALGTRNEEKGIVQPMHNDGFDIDEDSLAIGATMQVLNALTILDNPR